jgi:hypothetical protein
MDENDEELMGEWYQPTERELLPEIDILLEKLAVTETKKTVSLKWLKFDDETNQKISKLAQESGVLDIDMFLQQTTRIATAERAHLMLKRENHELRKRPNEMKTELEAVRKTTSKLIDSFIQLGDTQRNFLRQDLHSGLKYVFGGNLTQISVEDIVRFLHLIETTANTRKSELVKYQHDNAQWFVFRLNKLWAEFVKEPNKYGNKDKFIKFVEIIMKVIGYPSGDVRRWLDEKLSENGNGGISF